MTTGSFTIILLGLVNSVILILAIVIYMKTKVLQAELEKISFRVRK
jgi:hypothetical protein